MHELLLKRYLHIMTVVVDDKHVFTVVFLVTMNLTEKAFDYACL